MHPPINPPTPLPPLPPCKANYPTALLQSKCAPWPLLHCPLHTDGHQLLSSQGSRAFLQYPLETQASRIAPSEFEIGSPLAAYSLSMEGTPIPLWHQALAGQISEVRSNKAHRKGSGVHNVMGAPEYSSSQCQWPISPPQGSHVSCVP